MFKKEDVFSSPSYLEDYPEDGYCEYLIVQPKGSIITMKFDLKDHLEDQCHHDSIMVGI